MLHMGLAKRFVAELMAAKRAIVIPETAKGRDHYGIYLCEGNSGIFCVRMRKGFFNNVKIKENQSIIVIAY